MPPNRVFNWTRGAGPPLSLPRPNKLTGKWYKARYLAERHVIAACYAEWEIVGQPEIRSPSGAHFNPWTELEA